MNIYICEYVCRYTYIIYIQIIILCCYLLAIRIISVGPTQAIFGTTTGSCIQLMQMRWPTTNEEEILGGSAALLTTL